MKLLLTVAGIQKVRAGTEIFSTHLKKAFPDLNILDYKSQFGDKKPPLLTEPFMAKELISFLLKHHKTSSIDLIITNGMFGWSLPKLDIPVINVQHGTYAAFGTEVLRKTSLNYWRIRHLYAYFEKRSAHKSTAVISNSFFTKKNVLRHYNKESTVIYNAIDMDRFIPSSKKGARKKLDLPQEACICLYVGRPDHTKGYDILLEVARKNPDILFVCVLFPGIPSPRPNMRIFSHIDHTRLGLFYSAADVCINPSRFEGFGYVPLEALACNTPVLTNKVGVFHDLSLEGATILNNTPEAYLSALKDLPSSPHSRKAIRKHFSLQSFIKNYRGFFRDYNPDIKR